MTPSGPYPTGRLARGAARREVLERYLDTAEREARNNSRSLKCGDRFPGYPVHAGTLDGCANDGTGCLCECHDPVEPATGRNPR